MEPTLSDAEYMKYQKLIYDTCGINFTSNKKQLLISRLRKRLIATNTQTFTEYRVYILDSRNKAELSQMLNAISTNKTEFFRESEHFNFLTNKGFPRIKNDHSIRIWSAASSSGEEAYTLAMTFLEYFGLSHHKDVKILATDISTKVLNEAELAIYTHNQVDAIPGNLLRKYFLKGHDKQKGQYLVKDNLKNMVHFKWLNLMKPFPFNSKFQIVFCRNVMIYFDKPTREMLVEKIRTYLAPGGYLMIGNAESLSGLDTRLKYIQPAVYQRVD